MDALLVIGRQISDTLADPQVAALYTAHFLKIAQAESNALPTKQQDEEWPATVAKVVEALRELRLDSVSRVYHVSPDYYSWPLEQRALCMTAPSPSHLCKSVVMENKRWRPSTSDQPTSTNSRYYCVLVQYVQTVNTNTMTDFVRSLENNRLARKHFNFRLASPDVSLELTGFDNNGVCPIGMNQKIPLVMCESITRLQPPVFWLGAGHVDFKLAMPIQNFIDATSCMVADISVPLQE
ncbi:hypothetical protein GGI12_003015 [Dipsacomyces acuminosporus]|nr:hypothetical protein GGI12_003015 [Dipsacomyces acuminosporus]